MHSYVVATLPPGSRMEAHPIALAGWKLTPNMNAVAVGAHADFEYTGTGSPDSAVATFIVPVKPGVIYSFSAHVDPSPISQGQFDLFIDPLDGKFSYAVVWGGRGPARRFKTAPWRCPPGVTSVMLGMQIVGATVTDGAVLRFTRPELLSVNPIPATH